MTIYPLLTYDDNRPANHRETMLEYVRSAMADVVREAYDKGLNDGRNWVGNGSGNPYNGRQIQSDLGEPLFDFVKAFASARPLPGGTPDLTTFDDIAEVLDASAIPRSIQDKPLSLLERVGALAAALEEEQGYVEELRSEGEQVAAEFEGDLWKANRRILDRLGFDWSGVDSSGVTSEEVEDFIIDAITHLERKARPESSARRFKQTEAAKAVEA